MYLVVARGFYRSWLVLRALRPEPGAAAEPVSALLSLGLPGPPCGGEGVWPRRQGAHGQI